MIVLLSGCGTPLPALKPINRVDRPRYMGAWYAIAAIPTFIETEAYNGIETDRLEADGTIDTVFTVNQGSIDGPAKRYNPRGFVVDRVNNSTWGMKFLWPFKAEFLITHLNADYTQTVIGRNKRDYVWIMDRTPEIPDVDDQRFLTELSAQGYDLSKLRKVPQHWPAQK